MIKSPDLFNVPLAFGGVPTRSAIICAPRLSCGVPGTTEGDEAPPTAPPATIVPAAIPNFVAPMYDCSSELLAGIFGMANGFGTPAAAPTGPAFAGGLIQQSRSFFEASVDSHPNSIFDALVFTAKNLLRD